MTDNTQNAPSFENDVKYIFNLSYQQRMIWRLDLYNYEDVKENAQMIYEQIKSGAMPPDGFTKLTSDQIALFKLWMDNGYPP